jgi:Tol biopolymer transport system component
MDKCRLRSLPSLARRALVAASLVPFGCHAGEYTLVADTTPESGWAGAEAALLTNVRQLTREDMGIGDSGEAYFSPAMDRIIFQSYPPGQNKYQMFTLELTPEGEARSGTLRQVSPGGGACTCGFFRPDGRGIIYGSSYLQPDQPNPNFYHRSGSTYTWDMPGGMEVIAADLDGRNPRPLTRQPGYDAECAYSPDGEQIVFTSDRGGNPDLYVMNADGTGVRRLTNRAGYDGGPFFSPDGRRVIFRADRRQDDHLQLFVINADGTGERQLTRDSDVVNWAPYWLPGGRSVVFTTSIHGHRNYEVYLLNIETGRHRRVTFSHRFDGLPVISPDGRRMMWTSQRGPSGRSQVFLADFHTPEGY